MHALEYFFLTWGGVHVPKTASPHRPAQRPHGTGGSLPRLGFPQPAPGAAHPLAEKRQSSGDPSGFQRSSFTSRVPCVSFFKTESASRAWWRSLSSQHSGGEGKKISNSRGEREAGMVVYTCNPNIYKMEKGLKFEASLGNN